MSPKEPSELLYDSEATLRLVDSALRELGDIDADEHPSIEQRLRSALVQGTSRHVAHVGHVGHSELVARGYSEILGVLDSLRQSRNLLERATVEKIHNTHDKLREVSNATETAATDILNGLDRANSMVDALDRFADDHAEPHDRAAITRGALRDELFALMGHMQFQDITSQQLNYASSVLTDLEGRLAQIARAFDPTAFGVEPMIQANSGSSFGPLTFDPNASTENRADRQAVVDAIIAGHQTDA